MFLSVILKGFNHWIIEKNSTSCFTVGIGFLWLKMSSSKEKEIQIWVEKILHSLETEGEIDKIRQMIREQMSKSNWRDEIKKLCMPYMTEDQIEEATAETISEKIRDSALAAIPEQIKTFVLKYIQDFPTKKMFVEKLSSD
jgi:uncharacterized membrane-anchored protein YjiN (DUF445 family)